MGRIPDRWKDYSPCGKPIAQVPIISFKTPLTHKYNEQPSPDAEFVEEENWFRPFELVSRVRAMERELVVVIDLTNTFRYYNGDLELFHQQGVQYKKVKCQGQQIPNDEVMENVARTFNNVIHRHGRDGKQVAGIHCTHGVNRTGYLVARYMIEWLGYEPHAAIKTVGEARGHEIERQPYIDDLLDRIPGNRYKEWAKTAPPPPPPPPQFHSGPNGMNSQCKGQNLDTLDSSDPQRSVFQGFIHRRTTQSRSYQYRDRADRGKPYYNSNRQLKSSFSRKELDDNT